MRKILLIILPLLLISCGESDVKKFIKQTEQSKGTVVPLPALVTFKPYKYKAGQIRAPFGEDIPTNIQSNSPENETKVVLDNKTKTTKQDKTFKIAPQDAVELQQNPDGQRKKFYLEQFPLVKLKYVGSMVVKNYAWALIMDPNDNIHHVQIGDYLGQHNGKIKQILENKIVVRELIPNKHGAWEQQEVNLELSVKAKKDNEEQNATDREKSA